MIQVDNRIAGDPRYLYVESEQPLMRIPDVVRKCVVFIGSKSSTGVWICRGTGFFMAHVFEGQIGAVSYLITAKHVIDGIRDKGSSIVGVRINDKKGARWIETPVASWFFHPDADDVDIAALGMAIMADIEHRALSTAMVATDEKLEALQVGPGDDVFFTGLFSSHQGRSRNIPIMRVGNIAAMPEEKISTLFGLIDAYLVEARSIGGLSGCPVFLHIDPTGLIRASIEYLGDTHTFFLLGLMHGHFDEMSIRSDTEELSIRSDTEELSIRSDTEELLIEDSFGGKAVNIGIAVVVPATKILEVLDQPSEIKRRKEIENEIKKRTMPTMDVAGDS
jgi:hypothetical protein